MNRVTSHGWTSAGLSVIAVWGFLIGLAINDAATLIMAFFAFLLLLWLAAHDPKRWQESEFRYERDRERLP